ncbi:MAG: hypothetical protein AAGH78_10000 [Cyanobacteria bacterium P01_H01_bin.58]
MQTFSLKQLSTIGVLLGIASPLMWAVSILTLPSHAQTTSNRREFVNVDCVRSTNAVVSDLTEFDAVNCQLQRETELPLIVSTTPTPRALPSIDLDADPLERELEARSNIDDNQEFIINIVDVNASSRLSGQTLISKGANRFDLLAGRRVVVTVETQNFIPEARFIGPLGQNRRALGLSLQEQSPGVYQTIITPDEDGEYRVRILSRNRNGQLIEQNGDYTLSLQYE